MKNILSFIAFLCVLLCASAYGELPHVVSMRAGEHTGYHRLVVELSENSPYKVVNKKGVVELTLPAAYLTGLVDSKLSTELMEVEGVSTGKTWDEPGVLITIRINKDATVKEKVLKHPDRVIIDVYPKVVTRKPPSRSSKKAQAGSQKKAARAGNEKNIKSSSKTSSKAAGKKTAGGADGESLAKTVSPSRKDRGAKAAQEKTFTEKSTAANVKAEAVKSSLAPFNSGWRWDYRKKVIDVMRKDGFTDLAPGVVSDAFGFEADNLESLSTGLAAVASRYDKAGEANKAEFLKGLVSYIRGPEPVSLVEELIRKVHDPDLVRVGRFLVGYHYDKLDFHPEAMAHYRILLEGGRTGRIEQAALFRSGLISYNKGQYTEAGRWFERAFNSGHGDSSKWLASTLLVKGLTTEAWRIFNEEKPWDIESCNPVVLLSLADICTIKGQADDARKMYAELAKRYQIDGLLSSYFDIRRADTFLVEGNRDEAIRLYKDAYASLLGEGKAIAGLALADMLMTNGSEAFLKEAEAIYRDIAEGNYTGSESAAVSHITLLEKLGRYADVMDTVKAFSYRFSLNRYKREIDYVKADASYKWINERYEAGDWPGVVILSSLYGSHVGFGNKGEIYLKTGEALHKLQLYPDAVVYLNNAIKIGTEKVDEVAILTLAKVYLAQDDAVATQKLMKTFHERFPKSAHSVEAARIMLRIAYMSGDYKTAAAAESFKDDPELLMMKADSLARTNRPGPALAVYNEAAAIFEILGDKDGLKRAFIAGADQDYSMERYAQAAEGYGRAIRLAEPGDGYDMGWAMYRLAEVYTKLGENEKSRDTLDALSARNDIFAESAEKLVVAPGTLKR